MLGFGTSQASRRRRAAGAPPPPASLGALALASATIAENSAAGIVVGAILGQTGGSTLSLSGTAGGRFAIGGNNLIAGATATNFESATSHSITIRETLAGAVNSPRDTVLNVAVTNLFEAATLNPLSLSATSFTIGVPATGTVTGATAGSTIAANGLPGGLTVAGPARSWAWSGAGSAAGSTIVLTETLGDSANSPRASNVDVTVMPGASTSAVAVPSGFPYTPGFDILRTGTGTGSIFTTNIDMDALKPAYTETRYVDPAGNNDNDGLTAGTAIRSFRLAISMLNLALGTSGGGRIVFKSHATVPVVYRNSDTQDRTVAPLNAVGYRNSWGAFTNAPEPSFPNLVVEPDTVGGKAIMLLDQPFTGSAWTVFSGNIYERTYTGTLFSAGTEIVDFANLDRSGCPRKLHKVTTTAGSQAAAINAAWSQWDGWEDYPAGHPKYNAPYGLGACWIDTAAKKVYVRTSSNRAPDADIHLLTRQGAGYFSTPGIDKTCWLRGLHFIGGQGASGSFKMNSASGRTMRLYADRCGFQCGDADGALILSGGGGLAILKDCFGGYSQNDWVNPHGVSNTTNNALSWTVLEIGSRCDWPGWDATVTSNNGTTNHEAGYHVLVDCSYLNGKDRVVHMIQTTRTWALGGEVSSRRGADAGAFSSGYTVTDTALMWLDACRIVAPPKVGPPQREIGVGSGSTVYHANLDFAASDGGQGGTVTPYAA